jgi:hypothetical protein
MTQKFINVDDFFNSHFNDDDDEYEIDDDDDDDDDDDEDDDNDEDKDEDEDEVVCLHSNINKINGQNTCIDCGEMFETFDKDAEWRFYGNGDNRHTNNPSRCHLSREKVTEDKNIYTDLAKYDLPDVIKSTANDIFKKHVSITNYKEYKNNNRLGIILGCVAQAYEYLGKPQNIDLLCKKMNISQKKIGNLGKKEIEQSCLEYLDYKTSYELTIFELVTDFIELLNFRNDEFLMQIHNVIDKMYWSNDTLITSLKAKNIAFNPITITRHEAKYYLYYYFTKIKPVSTTTEETSGETMVKTSGETTVKTSGETTVKTSGETTVVKTSGETVIEDPIPTLEKFLKKDSILLKSSFKQSIAVGLIYYTLLLNGWTGIYYHQHEIFWFNIFKPTFIIDTVKFKGWLYICNRIAIWLPFERNQIIPKIKKSRSNNTNTTNNPPTTTIETLIEFNSNIHIHPFIENNYENINQIQSRLQFTSKSDVFQFFEDSNDARIHSLMPNYGSVTIIMKKEFAKIMGYSEITVFKIAAEIDCIAESNVFGKIPKKKKSKERMME